MMNWNCIAREIEIIFNDFIYSIVVLLIDLNCSLDCMFSTILIVFDIWFEKNSSFLRIVFKELTNIAFMILINFFMLMFTFEVIETWRCISVKNSWAFLNCISFVKTFIIIFSSRVDLIRFKIQLISLKIIAMSYIILKSRIKFSNFFHSCFFIIFLIVSRESSCRNQIVWTYSFNHLRQINFEKIAKNCWQYCRMFEFNRDLLINIFKYCREFTRWLMFWLSYFLRNILINEFHFSFLYSINIWIYFSIVFSQYHESRFILLISNNLYSSHILTKQFRKSKTLILVKNDASDVSNNDIETQIWEMS